MDFESRYAALKNTMVMLVSNQGPLDPIIASVSVDALRLAVVDPDVAQRAVANAFVIAYEDAIRISKTAADADPEIRAYSELYVARKLSAIERLKWIASSNTMVILA